MPHDLRQEVQGYSSWGEELLEKVHECHLYAYCLFAYLWKEVQGCFSWGEELLKKFIHVALGEVALNHVNN